MRKVLYFFIFISLIVMIGSVSFLSAETIEGEYFKFREVLIGGGGYVTGLVIHPSNSDLMYVRTDVGGAYRWDSEKGEWIQLLNSLDIRNEELRSIDGISLAKTDENIIYIAAGNARNDIHYSDVLKSTDKGETWERTYLNVPQAFEGNQRDVRYTGERIAVDPVNKKHVYVGTKKNGLYYTEDGAQNWQHHSDIPGGSIESDADAGIVGIRTIVFDERETIGEGETLRTKTIYVGAYEDGIYKSTDGGKTFARMPGSPETARRMVVAADGTLWVTTAHGIGWTKGGHLYHYDGYEWLDKTPFADVDQHYGDPYGALAVDPGNSDKVIVARGKNRSNQPIYGTEDGGETWKHLNQQGNRIVNKLDWWEDYYFSTGPSAIVFKEANSAEIWMADGYGVWQVKDIWLDNTEWDAVVKGIEELVVFTLESTSTGAPLHAGVADADGFRLKDNGQFPDYQDKFDNPHAQETTGIAYQETKPANMARVGSFGWGKRGFGSWSTDNGLTWTEFKSYPGKADNPDQKAPNGKIAISATNFDNMVVIPMHREPHYTKDRGKSWHPTNLAITNIVDNLWLYNHILESDKVNGNKFYIFDKRKGDFYRSNDGGENFTLMHSFQNHEDDWRGTEGYWQEWVNVRAVPGFEDKVWINLPREGLYKSSDGGESWTKISEVNAPKQLSFGKGAPGSKEPAVYIIATISGEYGLYMSDDMGKTWRKCNGDDYGLGVNINTIKGDEQSYGKVYIGTGGMGVHLGEIAEEKPPIVTIEKNKAPIIDWLRPVKEASFDLEEKVVLEVDVSDPNGKDDIERVLFYDANGNLLYQDWQAPFIYSPGELSAGAYKYYAEALDYDGLKATTPVLSIDITESEIGPNILKNYGFESGDTANWDADWRGISEIDESEPYRGKYCIKLNKGKGGRAQNILEGEFIPGMEYTLTAHAMKTVEDDYSKIGVLYLDSSWNNIGEDAIEITSSSYKKHSMTVTIPEEAANLQVFIFRDEGEGHVYADDFIFNKGSQAAQIKLERTESTAEIQSKKYTAFKTAEKIYIDGLLDESIWNIKQKVDKKIIGSSDNEALFDVLWDEEYLYIGAMIKDEQLFSDSDRPWNDDSLEIYIDADHSRSTSYDSFDRQYVIGYNRSEIWEQGGKTEEVLHAWSLIDGGYSIEVAIPWLNLGIDPLENQSIGFDIGFNDDDNGGEREAQYIWSGGEENWTNTIAFGDLTLSSEIIDN